MDRLIWTAWRAFWIGLGASSVLIAQSLLGQPPAGARTPAPAVEELEAGRPIVAHERSDAHVKFYGRIRNAS
jgi:hypothetical protein